MDSFKEESKIQKIIKMIEKGIEDGKIEDVIVQQNNGGINYSIIEKKAILRVNNLTEEEKKQFENLAIIARVQTEIREEKIIDESKKYDKLLEPYTVPDESENKKGIKYTTADLDRFAEVEERNIKQSPKKITKKRYKYNKIKVSIKDLLDKMGNISVSEKQKEKMKGNLKNAIVNGKKFIAIGMAVSIGLFGTIIVNKEIDDAKAEKEITTESELEDDTTENPIDTIQEVKTDFIKHYLKAYNETYGTDYTQANLYTEFLNNAGIYQLEDGRKVTRGNYPYETQNVLNQIGEYKGVQMNGNLVQIVLLNGKILGSYNVTTGEFMYSGNQTEDLTNEDFDEPTLEKLGINKSKLTAAAKVNMAQYGEDQRSIDMRIEHYNNTDIEPER